MGEKTAKRSEIIQVGGIDYLNALPLTAFLELNGQPRFEITNLAPSALAAGLRHGDLDIALVPAVEYLSSPNYRVVGPICISSYGAVESIRLYFRRPLEDVRHVALDASSRTSAMLTKLLFRRLWGGSPGFLDVSPQAIESYLAAPSTTADGAFDDVDAALLIGDVALRQPETTSAWEQLDLGTVWTRWTGLPLVYAVWVWRHGDRAPVHLQEQFERARHDGVSRIDDIVRRWPGSRQIGEARCRNYLTHRIGYDLGTPQVEGLLRYFSLLAEAGLTSDAPRELRFLGPTILRRMAPVNLSCL